MEAVQVIRECLAAEGAAVVVNYLRSAGEAASLVDEIHSHGGKALAVQASVASTEFQPSRTRYCPEIDRLPRNPGEG